MTSFPLRYVAISSSDFVVSHEFLCNVLGVREKWAEVPKFAEFFDQVGVALVADHDLPMPGLTTIMVKVESVDVAVDELLAAGAVLKVPSHDGGHETRALVSIPGSTCGLLLYGNPNEPPELDQSLAKPTSGTD